MRIAIVSGYDAAVPGGVQTQVRALARVLTTRGNEVTVIAPGRGDPHSSTAFMSAGRSWSIAGNGSLAPVAPSPAAARRTLRGLSAVAPEVVHVHEPLVPGPPLAALFSPWPVVATFHRSGADVLYRLEGRLLGRRALRHMAEVTAVSTAARETAEQVLGSDLGHAVEIPNGVDSDRFGAARRALFVPPGSRFKSGETPLVVVFGRLERRKGVEVAMRALDHLPFEVRLVVAGDGPERESLEASAAGDPRVHFAGRVGDDELATLVARADVAVAPALSGESFGLVLLEAMAAGTAVVASDLAGYEEAGEGVALHVPAGDAASLGAAVGRLLADDEARAERVRRGLRRAEECSMEVVASAYLACYERARAVERPPVS